MPHQYRIQYGDIIKLEMVLLQYGHPLAGGYLDASFIRLHFAAQYFQESALASAICADHAIAISAGEIEVHLFKQYTLSVGQFQVSYADHLIFTLPKRVIFLSGKGKLIQWF